MGPYGIPCVSLTFEDKDFDVSIVVVAATICNNAKKTYWPCKTPVGETYLHSKVFCLLQLYLLLHQHKAQGST
jgi:hypothetical protein